MNPLERKRSPGRAALLLLPLAFACQAPPVPELDFQGEALGASYRVRLTGRLSEAERAGVREAIESALQEVSASLSSTDPGSDLSRLNRARAGEKLPIANATFDVFREAVSVSELTGGAFDVTAAPLARLFGKVASPATEDVEQARARVGYRHLALDDDSLAITKGVDSLECDVTELARAYAVDRMAEALEAGGYRDYLVELGGDLRTRGKDGAGEAWRVEVSLPPVSSGKAAPRTLSLTGLALASSRNPRSFPSSGASHPGTLVDPRTALPLGDRLAAVSALEDTCLRAKALAGGFLALGPEEGYELAARMDTSALFLLHSDGGAIEEKATPAFADLFEVCCSSR